MTAVVVAEAAAEVERVVVVDDAHDDREREGSGTGEGEPRSSSVSVSLLR
jgi:hypothetical protein